MNLKNPRKLERDFEEPYASLYHMPVKTHRVPEEILLKPMDILLHTNGFKK